MPELHMRIAPRKPSAGIFFARYRIKCVVTLSCFFENIGSV